MLEQIKTPFSSLLRLFLVYLFQKSLHRDTSLQPFKCSTALITNPFPQLQHLKESKTGHGHNYYDWTISVSGRGLAKGPFL